jgi:hypothetical protein
MLCSSKSQGVEGPEDENGLALAKIKQLQGILPICSSCKKNRDDAGYWHQVEVYISRHTDADFSHSQCEECARKLYPEIYKDKE